MLQKREREAPKARVPLPEAISLSFIFSVPPITWCSDQKKRWDGRPRTVAIMVHDSSLICAFLVQVQPFCAALLSAADPIINVIGHQGYVWGMF